MPVFGEEVVEIDIFNGISTATSHRKKNYCFSSLNLVKTREKELTVREDYVMEQLVIQVATAIPVATNGIPKHFHDKDIEVFTATGIAGVDTPTLLVVNSSPAGTRNVTWLNFNSSIPASYTQAAILNRQVKAFCQYKDRYYASNGVDWIYRLSGFTTALGALTNTDLSNVGVNILKAFKNRIFGFTKNRIYFTDLPAIGLYPETWNLVTNFIDMPSLDKDLNIYSVKVFKDKLYIFTDRGIFYLMANGDPLNWTLQLVTANFCVYSTESVCQAKNNIFLTDQDSVFMFDGSKFTKISDVIQELFYNSTSTYWMFSVFAYEDGIILCRNEFNNVAGNYSAVVPSSNLLYYFNMSVWVGLRPADPVGGYGFYYQLIKADTDLIPYRGINASSYLTYATNSASQGIMTVRLERGKWQGDCYDTDHVAGVRTTKPINIIGPAIFSELRTYKKIKYFEVYGKFNQLNPVSGSIGMGASWHDAAVDLTAQKPIAAAMSKYNSIIRVPIGVGFTAARGSKFMDSMTSIYISGLLTSDANAVGGNEPPFILTKVEAIVNTDNKSGTELRTP